MRFFKKPERRESPEPQADETTPGVRMLKDVWHIDTEKKPREAPPAQVSSDIYHLPPRNGQVPHRHHGHASE